MYQEILEKGYEEIMKLWYLKWEILWRIVCRLAIIALVLAIIAAIGMWAISLINGDEPYSSNQLERFDSPRQQIWDAATSLSENPEKRIALNIGRTLPDEEVEKLALSVTESYNHIYEERNSDYINGFNTRPDDIFQSEIEMYYDVDKRIMYIVPMGTKVNSNWKQIAP